MLVGGETCDDGNLDDTDACAKCKPAACGDSFVHAGVEACDDANLDDTDACLATCVAASCGDGFVQAGVEECDDANADDTDGCLSSCLNASCGDGFIQAGVETCDDGNTLAGDGCSDTCAIECGTDCWGPNGCLTPSGRCVQFTCRAGDSGGSFCNSCLGWEEVSYDQWMNQGYCSDVIQTFRSHYGSSTFCGSAPSCCADSASCAGGDNAWHFFDGSNTRYVGPCLGCANDTNCSYWNGTDNSPYTRITACERQI